MNIEQLANIINIEEFEGNKVCISGQLHNVIELLKDKLSFKILKSITAVDLGDEIELMYDLFSIENEETVVISIKVQNEIESITDLFESARADENEIYDMFGIHFLGNEDLKRLYMPENWEGYPLRKDYIQDDTRLAWNDDEYNA